MKIEYSSKFKRHFKKRIANDSLLLPLFEEKLKLFINDPRTPELLTHKLTGNMKSFHAFSVAYDCRIVFTFEENKTTAIFVDIGTHHEVY